MIESSEYEKGMKVTTSDKIGNSNDIKVTNDNVIIGTDTGSILKPKTPANDCNLDNSPLFEERSNPLSSKGG